MGAPKLNPEPGPPSGYEETGFVTREVPGVGISVASSNAPNHTYEMLADAFTDGGHTGFLLDAKVMAAVLYDFLTNPRLREAVKEEHRTLASLLQRYHAALREAYSQEVGTTPTGR